MSLLRPNLMKKGEFLLLYPEASLTFVHPCVFVLYHRQLIDLAKLLEDGLQVLLLQVSGYLPDEELDCVRLLH